MFVYLTVTDELLAERAVPNRNVPLAISGPPLDCQGVRANFFLYHAVERLAKPARNGM